MDLVRIKAGTFLMGSPQDEVGRDPEQDWQHEESPQHQVAISRDFMMSTTPVTNHQWDSKGFPSRLSVGSSPVVGVPWFKALQYCNSLSEAHGLDLAYTLHFKEGLIPNECFFQASWKGFDCNGYRLPTEAEWEYACRAGTKTRFTSGDSVESLGRMAHYDDGLSSSNQIPVASLEPNSWGLYDMHGLVQEWCWDSNLLYDYLRKIKDPFSGMVFSYVNGGPRILRGGSVNKSADDCRSAKRGWGTVHLRSADVGFRIVKPV